ncbi:MAG TPA: F0F1 ATP synthase subunit A [Marmoricola sp.]|jgi:F-type H+-transporting ATPase subunit a
MIGGIAPLAIEIHPGEHPTGQLFGMTFNLDTIWVTVVAGAIVVALGFWARAQLTKRTEDHVPTRLQLVWETVVKEVNTQVEDNLGTVHPLVVPLAVALFFFILIANWIEVIPTELNQHVHLLPSPTADTNLTYAMAVMVIVGVWGFGIRRQGLGGYLKHFYGQSIFPEKPAVDTPIRIVFTFLNVLEELVKPITLALRLFGNIFAGGIMIALIGALVAIAPLNIPVGGFFTLILNVIWKLFDTMFLGALQAFIFALLTVLYFGMAAAGHGHGGDDEPEKGHAGLDEPAAAAAEDRAAVEQEPELAH